MESEIVGQKVRLRFLRQADLEQRAVWTADDELAVLMGVDIEAEPFVSQEEEVKGNHAWFAGRQRAGAVLYAIEVDGRTIGDIDITIDSAEHRAELSVFIGDRSQWGKGYGTEAVELVLDALRVSEGVRTVVIGVPHANTRSHRLWRKLGFTAFDRDEKQTHYVLQLGG